MEIAEKIKRWIEKELKTRPEEYATAIHKSFGFVTMKDETRAQVQVTLEMDEDAWMVE